MILQTTGQSMRDRVGYQQSQTINNDRNVQDLIRLSKSAGGGIPMELTHSPIDEGLERLIEAALSTTETVLDNTFGSPAINNGAKTLDGTYTSGVEVGDIIRVSGATAAADNGYFRVTVVASGLLTVAKDANFAADEAVTVTRGARYKNGTDEKHFSIEVARLDLQVAQVFSFCTVNGMDFSVADGAITGVNFSFEAATSTRYATNNGTADKFGPGSPTYGIPSTRPVLDSIGVPQIRAEGTAYAAKSINMAMMNNIAPRTQVGTLGTQSMRFGEFGASGRVSAFLEDFTALTAYANNTSSNLWLVMEDSSGRGWSISFPEIKYSDAAADVSGSNTDVLEELSVTAYKDPVEACTVRLQRWD
jgi:hypothetical protein